jgi:hypothetical protein
MLIAFATALGAVACYPGKTAAGSGPYAAVLADELVKSGQDQLQLFQKRKRARVRVDRTSPGTLGAEWLRSSPRFNPSSSTRRAS